MDTTADPASHPGEPTESGRALSATLTAAHAVAAGPTLVTNKPRDLIEANALQAVNIHA